MESTERWQQNKQLSVFDGIPIAVKDEIFVVSSFCAITDFAGSRICSKFPHFSKERVLNKAFLILSYYCLVVNVSFFKLVQRFDHKRTE